MKLTWFGATALRLQIAGQILVFDPEGAPQEVRRAELVGGADRIVRLATDEPSIEVANLRSSTRVRPRSWLEQQASEDAPAVYHLWTGARLVTAPGEPPLVLDCGQDTPDFGRGADGAVVVLLGDGAVLGAVPHLNEARASLVALAVSADRADEAFAALSDVGEGAVVTVLEPGLALEV